ncbi:Fhl1p [Saccharomyces cerevisiae x Saccharomyces kudriavzevii VIN7]|uniref:Fhl1p n=1 Tax=Saccharomyces cerevisiae x Saccharomyces kudriavzevii (strain VIN7) TaxID=1095631 RepID=H0H2G6_SACCK|nr:Fhl1p [Saccharomyces cerevisiae x Saccharomyces kudriavzevii VIN7]
MDREMAIVEGSNHLGSSSPTANTQITINTPLLREQENKESITEPSSSEVPMEAGQPKSPQIETGETLPISPKINIEKEIETSMADDNGNLKLELPDNLDNADFSKLLEFDAKNDEALFNSNELLSQTMDTVNNINASDDHNREATSEGNANIEAAIRHDDEKEQTQDNTGAVNTEEIKVFEATGIQTDQATTDTIYTDEHKLPISKDDATLSTVVNDKHNLLPTRNDSITPVMFQQHELLAQPSQTTVTENNSTDAETTERRPSEPIKEGLPLPHEQPTIFAYARLDFQSFTFYVQTLHAIIGRRSENDFSHKVDVNLGPSKSISRRHAQIFYNFGTGRFELSIIGKNGAFVDDIFVEKGNTVPLRNRTKIQIGQIPFQFILPEQERNDDSKSPESADVTESEIKTKNPKKNEPKSKKKTTTGTKPKKTQVKLAVKKEKRPPKLPKKVYTLEEIPVEYRTKPTISYSAMLTTCIRKYSTAKGMSLSEIYAGIRELFPYYKYCPDGWQSSVRHNLSLNKSFRKVSKEGKGWLWGLDEEYIAERERQKKKQSEIAVAKAHAAQLKLEQQQHRQQQVPQKGKKEIVSQKSGITSRKQNISQTLAANRAASNKKNTASDNQRTMKYLQEQLVILTRDRKGLSKQVIAAILTQALAMTINQVTQAAKNKGITGNPLTALMDKNPQHLNLILAAAVNAATAKVTKGEVKQLVDPETTAALAAKAQHSKPIPRPIVQTPNVPDIPASQLSSSSSSHSNNYMHDKPAGSFDPSSLSRFFQPRQNARVASPAIIPVPATISQNVDILPKPKPIRDSGDESESDSSSSGGSSSGSGSDSDSGSDDESVSGSDDDSTSSESESGSDSGSEMDEKDDKGDNRDAKRSETEGKLAHHSENGNNNGRQTLEPDEEGHDSKRRKIDEEISPVNVAVEESIERMDNGTNTSVIARSPSMEINTDQQNV